MQNLTKLFIVVIHIKNWKQALDEAAKVLVPGGAHGVIFISMSGEILSGKDYPNIFDLAEEAKKLHPDYLVGVNCLDLINKPAQAIELAKQCRTLDILWADIGGIHEIAERTFIDSDVENALRRTTFQYFGSEWFKYRTEPTSPERVMKEAAQHFDAVITSGDATGSPPTLEKIQSIRKWIGPDKMLGNASGIGEENIETYLPYINYFLIATKICMGNGKGENMYWCDIEKVKAVRAKIDAYVNSN